MNKSVRRAIIILMLVIGAMLLVSSFTVYFINGVDYKGENPYFGLGFIGILLMVMSSAVAKHVDLNEITAQLQGLKDKYGIRNIIIEDGDIASENITHGNKVYQFIDDDGGYNLETAIKLINKHSQECTNKVVLIRHEKGDMNTGTVFDLWGLYIQNGEIINANP